MTPECRIEPLSPAHEREGFHCGEPSLDEYLKRYASQHARKDISRTYVAVPPGEKTVLGYYTISGASIAFDSLPEKDARRLPRYPIPAAHLGRLAVDERFQGRGLGEVLLLDALGLVARLSQRLGIHAVTVDVLNERARAFYLQYGFIPLEDDDLHLYLPVKVVRDLLTGRSQGPNPSSPHAIT